MNWREVRYPDDCQRIQKIALSLGHQLSLMEAERLWEYESDKFCASWLILGDDEELREVLRGYL